MRERHTMRKRFDRTHDEQMWSQYKIARNDVNKLNVNISPRALMQLKMIRDQHGDLSMNFRPANRAVPLALKA